MRRNKLNWVVPKGAELTELDKKYFIIRIKVMKFLPVN